MVLKAQIDRISNKIHGDIFNNCVLGIFLVCLLLAPPIHIWNFRFTFQVIDFFIPIFLCMIIYNKWYKNWRLLYVKNLLFFIGVIILSILINKQIGVANEWFEVYKGFKYLLIFIVFKELYSAKKNTAIIDVIFICLLFFNFLHYHNIFNFNQIVMPLYCGKDCVHLTYFGLNSAGLPAVKRMIGTMANPNDNAVLFLVFMLFYLPKERWKIKDVSFFVLCLIALLACQSRTSLVAFFVIIIAHFFIIRIKWQKLLIYSALIVVVMFVFFYITAANKYALTLLDGTALKSYSWTYRLELWKQFLGQSLTQPIFGHAPQKNYFYEHKLHFENEYILFLWRYGILGFISLIGFYLTPIKKIFRTVRSNEISKNTLLLIILFAICGLANVPLTNTTLSLLFFGYLGIFYSQKNKDYENLA